MVWNPCQWNLSLEVAVMVVAVIEAVQYSYACVIIVVGLDDHRDPYFVPRSYRTSKRIDLYLYSIAFLVAIGLFFGSQKKSVIMCWIWLAYTGLYAVLISLKAIIIVDGTCCDFRDDDYWYKDDIISSFFWLTVEFYFAYVVYAFIKQLGEGSSQQINPELGDATPAGAQESATAQT